MRTLSLCLGLLFAFAVATQAAEPAVVEPTESAVAQPVTSAALYLLQAPSVAELQALLERAQALGDAQKIAFASPIEMVLQDESLIIFARKHYRENKALVDLVARLDAFNVIAVKVGEDALRQANLSSNDLPSFVHSVKDATAEVQRLRQQGYQPLSVENPT
ncbi:MAG: hypothetical protein RL217_383 [Pseudomonadota bacterium]|jgi:intracellular sulfur oxidation DsrE/DsrF family protein